MILRDHEMQNDECVPFLKQRGIFSGIKDYAIIPKGVSRVNGSENIVIGIVNLILLILIIN